MSLVSIVTGTDTKGGGGGKSVVEHDDDDDDDEEEEEEDASVGSAIETATEVAAVASGSGNIAESGDVIKTLSVQKPRNAKNQAIFLVNFKDELYLPVKADEKEMTKFRLIQPKLLEENAGPFACTYCDKKFRFNSKLKRHIGIHTGIKPFQCDYCSSRFSQIAGLRRHLITHTGRTAYQCRICEKYCSSSVELKRHLRTHTDEGFYQCEYCTKNYLQLRSLKRHILQHEHVRKYPCKLCDAFFPGKIFLDAHYRQHSRQQSINITYGLPFDHNTYVAVPNSVADKHASALIGSNNNRDFKIILKPTGAFDQPEAVLVANAFCDQQQQQQQRRLMGEQSADGRILIRTTDDMNGSTFSADPTISLNGAGDIGSVEDSGTRRTILICDDATGSGDASSLAAALNIDGQQNIVITDSASNVIINELLYSSSDNVKIVYSAEEALPQSVLLNGYDGSLTAESALCRNELYQTMAIVTTSGTGNGNDCFAGVADGGGTAELDVETTTTTTTTTTVVQQNAGNIVVDAASVLLNSFAVGEDDNENIIGDGADDVALIGSFESGNSNLSRVASLQDDEKPTIDRDEQSTIRKSNVAVQVESGGDNDCDYYVQEFAAAADQLFMFGRAGDGEQRLDVKKERDTVIMLNQSVVTTLSPDNECTEFQLLADSSGERSNSRNEDESILVGGVGENRFQLLNGDNEDNDDDNVDDDDDDGAIGETAANGVMIKNEESDFVYEDGFDEDGDILYENDAITVETDSEKVPIDSSGDGGLVGIAGQEEIIAVTGASATAEDYIEQYRDDSDGDNIYAIMNNVNYLVERSDIESFSCQLDDDDDNDDIDVLDGSAVGDACDEQIAIVTTSAAGFATVDDEEEENENVDFSLEEEENYEESCTVQHLRQNLFAAESGDIGSGRVTTGAAGIVLSNETLSNNTTYIAINDSSVYSNSSETIFNHFQSDSNLYIVQQSSATLATAEANSAADGAGHIKSSIAIVKNGQIYLID